MGQYISTLNSTSNSHETQQTQGRNLVLENQRLRNIINKINTAVEKNLAERTLRDEKKNRILPKLKKCLKILNHTNILTL